MTEGAASASEALAGLVERVTFHNPESGFCVLRVKARGQKDVITVVGHAAVITAGEFVQLAGAWVNDRTHGLQFRATFLKASPPTTLEGIERYLGSGMIPGIGAVYARRLVREFGEGVFDLIEQQPDRLREVAGIGPKRAALDAHGVTYKDLDGSTPSAERERRVASFQAGEADLFLISLRAGGTGLNLTAADYVVHLDPWWNPAVEDQASDRAHRIGQTRPVTIYRLVMADSIEQRIVELHRAKRELAAELLEGTDTAGRLTEQQLLEFIGG